LVQYLKLHGLRFLNTLLAGPCPLHVEYDVWSEAGSSAL